MAIWSGIGYWSRSRWINGCRGLAVIEIQLQQVLLNLITNAIHSMAVKDGSRVLRMSCETDDDGVIVSVADTGTGIDVEVAEWMCEPLFTTKSDRMGKGLSICRSI